MSIGPRFLNIITETGDKKAKIFLPAANLIGRFNGAFTVNSGDFG